MEQIIQVGNNSKVQPNIPQAYHIPNKRRTFACKVLGREVILNYIKPNDDMISKDEIYYATCSPFGKVDWNTTKIYTPHALVPMDNVWVVPFMD